MQILKLLLSLWHIFLNIIKTGKFSSLEGVGQIFDNENHLEAMWSKAAHQVK
jgi:hypothetical protein